MEKNYVPQPMDTSDIKLPEELNVLIEKMAKNVHEVWAEVISFPISPLAISLF